MIKLNKQQQIECFCKDITDFMVLHVSSQSGIGQMSISNELLEDRWSSLKHDYKLIPAKNHKVKDIWKKLSAIMSKHFITKKMIKADQVTFKTHPNFLT